VANYRLLNCCARKGGEMSQLVDKIVLVGIPLRNSQVSSSQFVPM
jgi:hypothetical protein